MHGREKQRRTLVSARGAPAELVLTLLPRSQAGLLLLHQKGW